MPKINEEAITELLQIALYRLHEHDDNCGTPEYRLGYLQSSVELYLAGRADTERLRADLDHVVACQRAAGRAH